MKKLFTIVTILIISLAGVFAERWHCYMSNDTTEAYYNIDYKGTYFDEEGVYDVCARDGSTYWLVEDVQLSKKSMGEDYIHYLNATKYGYVEITKGSETYVLYWLGCKTDYMMKEYHTWAWVDVAE